MYILPGDSQLVQSNSIASPPYRSALNLPSYFAYAGTLSLRRILAFVAVLGSQPELQLPIERHSHLAGLLISHKEITWLRGTEYIVSTYQRISDSKFSNHQYQSSPIPLERSPPAIEIPCRVMVRYI